MNWKITLVAVLVLATTLLIGGKFAHEYVEDVKQSSYQAGLDAGQQEALEMAVDEFHKSMYLADKGASNLLVLKDRRTEIPVNDVVNQLQHQRENPPINDLVDLINTAILKSMVNFEDFSVRERDSLLIAYQDIHPDLAAKVANDYLQFSQSSKGDTSVQQAAKQFMQSISENTCDLVGLLNPSQKRKLAKNLIQAGKISARKKGMDWVKKFNSTSKVLDELSDKICHTIAENSFVVVNELFKHNAAVRDFNDYIVINSHQRELVKKMVSVEDEMTITFQKTLKREIFGFDELAIDANAEMKADVKISAGIDLNEYFSVNVLHNEQEGLLQNTILITVLPPKILTTDVDFHVKSLNEFFSKNIRDEEFNEMTEECKQKAELTALKKNILEEARKNIQVIFEEMYAPVLLDKHNYRLMIDFKEGLDIEETNSSEFSMR